MFRVVMNETVNGSVSVGNLNGNVTIQGNHEETAWIINDSTIIDNSSTEPNRAYHIWMVNKNEFQYMYPSLIYLVILLVLGLTGNSCVLYIYGSCFKKTTANFFIVILAWLDLAACALGLPYEMVDVCFSLINGEPISCKIFRAIQMTTECAAANVLVCIGYDRYLHICKPLKIFTAWQARKMIYITISVSFLSVIPSLFMYGTSQTVVDGTQLIICSYDDMMRGMVMIVYIILTIILSADILLLCVMYVRIGHVVHVWRKTKLGESTNMQPTSASQQSSSGRTKNSRLTSLTQQSTTRSTSVSQQSTSGSASVSQQSTSGSTSVSQQSTSGSTSVSQQSTSGSTSVFQQSTSGSTSVSQQSTSGSTSVSQQSTSGSTSVSQQSTSGSTSVSQQSTSGSTSVSQQSTSGSTSVSQQSTSGSNKHSHPTSASQSTSGSNKSSAMIRTVLMLLIVSSVFVLSYIPFMVITILINFGLIKRNALPLEQRQGFEVANRSFFLSNALNPLVYFAFDRKFRSECFRLIYKKRN